MSKKEKSGVIIVPDAKPGLAGSVVFWRLSGNVSIERLTEEWKRRGLDEALLPELPTPIKALCRAVREQRQPRRLIRPMAKRSGWCIVDERVEAGGEDLRHHTDLKVKLNAIGGVVVEPDGGRISEEIRTAFAGYLTALPRGDVGGWLSRMVHKVCAVALRDTGGFYFVPQEYVARWESWAEALEASSACEVHGMPAMQAAKAVRAILSGIIEETGTITERMNREIPKLGEKALNSRLSECEDVEAKIAFYEGFLGTTLDSLHDEMKKLKAAIAAGILAAGGDEEEDS